MRHSLSPTIHNAAFSALDLDWVYVALPVAADRGAEAVAAMDVLGIDGLSVTMPHKAAVAAAAPSCTPTVQALGVANCVFRRDGTLVADSTDGDGFVRSLLLDEGVDLAGADVAVIGTGGAARSIIEALGRTSATSVRILSRDPARAEAICPLAPQATVGEAADAAVADVIVNASPVGMAGHPDAAASPVANGMIRSGHLVVDIVYEPRRTPLLVQAEAVGARTVNGVGMLVHQAAIAFEHWTGREAPLDAMRAAAFPS